MWAGGDVWGLGVGRYDWGDRGGRVVRGVYGEKLGGEGMRK